MPFTSFWGVVAMRIPPAEILERVADLVPPGADEDLLRAASWLRSVGDPDDRFRERRKVKWSAAPTQPA